MKSGIYEGSSKNLLVINPPMKNEMGLGWMIGTNYYSVKDWGRMPDKVNYRNCSNMLLGAVVFEALEEKGYFTHYEGMVEDGEVKRLRELEGPSNIMQVKLVNVYKPDFVNGKYDYSFFKQNQGRLNNYLPPLECIYRDALPLGSSVFEKLADGRLVPADIGLDEMPKPGTVLPKPIYDFTTKFEETGDRMVRSRDELLTISGLNEDQFQQLETVLNEANKEITRIWKLADIVDYDGKLEFIWNNGPGIGDNLGTLDESRGGRGKFQVSKEPARQYHNKEDAEWAKMISKYKNNGPDWREDMRSDGLFPKKLKPDFNRLWGWMYGAVCNEVLDKVIGRKFFDLPSLNDVLKEMEELGFALYVTG